MASVLLLGSVCQGIRDIQNINLAISDLSNTVSNLPNVVPAFAQYYSSQTQLNLGAGIATPLSYNGVFVESNISIDLLDNTIVKITNPGTYRIMTTIQMDSSGGGPSNTANVWFAVDGNPVRYSNSVITVSNQDENIIAVEYFYTFTVPGYFQIYFESPNGQVNATAYPLTVVAPETPSVITSVQKIA